MRVLVLQCHEYLVDYWLVSCYLCCYLLNMLPGHGDCGTGDWNRSSFTGGFAKGKPSHFLTCTPSFKTCLVPCTRPRVVLTISPIPAPDMLWPLVGGWGGEQDTVTSHQASWRIPCLILILTLQFTLSRHYSNLQLSKLKYFTNKVKHAKCNISQILNNKCDGHWRTVTLSLVTGHQTVTCDGAWERDITLPSVRSQPRGLLLLWSKQYFM